MSFDALPLLKALVGRWRVEMTTRDDGRPSTARDLMSEKASFADGRYVEERLQGAFGGSRHEKRTLLGFNPTRARFEYVTADNHDAVLLLYASRAPADPASAAVDLYADYVSPGDAAPRGVLLTVRTRIEVVAPDEHRLDNFYAEPGQPERPFLTYIYRRLP